DGAEIIGHAPPAWAMGSPDWQLGDSQPGFTGTDAPLPAIGARSGRLGVGLGSLALALGGAVGGQVINLSAASTLELVSSASCDAEIVGQDRRSHGRAVPLEGLRRLCGLDRRLAGADWH